MSRIATGIAAALLSFPILPPVLANATEVPALGLEAGVPLSSVLATLNARGFHIVYSSALVRADMKLRAIPNATRIDEFLREILAPWNLSAINDANGDWLIVKGKARSSVPAALPTVAVAASEAAKSIETIDVTASRYGLATNSASAIFLDRSDVERIPHLADDAVRVLKLLPGVSGGDYSAALNIRGGRRDETLLMIDGTEIHNGFHFRELEGALSVLDTHLVQGIDFITGGMTADYGDYMSGVVDLRTFTPSADDEYRHTLGISFVSAYGRTGGTFADGRGSWVAAARRGYLDVILERVQPDDERLTPRYTDVFASVQYEFDADTRLSSRLLFADDDLVLVSSNDDPIDSAGAGRALHFWVTLDHALNDSWNTRTVAATASMEHTRDSRGTEVDERTGDVVSDFDFSFFDFRQDWSWTGSERHLPRFGFNASRHEASYDYHLAGSIYYPNDPRGQIDIQRDTDLEVEGTRLGAFASWRMRVTDELTLEAGGRWDSYRYPQGLSWDVVSPRFNAVYSLGERGELRAALGVGYQPQGVDQLQVEDGVTDFFQPERSQQAVVSYTHRFEHGLSARVDVYRKEYTELRPRFENALDAVELIPEAAVDRIRIDAPEAEAQGVELTVRRQADSGFAGWASAAFAEARDREADGWVPRTWEQEFTFSFGASYSAALWSVNLAGQYHSGTPTTALTTVPVGGGEVVIVPEARNAARLGDYARLDFRVNRDVLLRSGKLSFYLEVTNLLDTRNVCCVENFDVDPRNSSRVIVEDGYWLPMMPSLGFQWEF
jgi:outer membrane cobalamin receptor